MKNGGKPTEPSSDGQATEPEEATASAGAAEANAEAPPSEQPASSGSEATLESNSTAATGPGQQPRSNPDPQRRYERRGSDRPSQAEWDRMKQKVRSIVREDLAPVIGSLSPTELEVEVRKALGQIIEREEIRITPIQRRAFVQQVLSDTLGLGPLDALLADTDVTEIMCNRYCEIWVERAGQITLSDVTFSTDDQYRSVIHRIVSAVGRRVDESSPMVDARLQDGSRVNVVIPPLSLDGAVLTIRKFPGDPLTADELVGRGIYTPAFAHFMEAAVRAKLNVLISGGTGSGKTTTLNIMSSFIPRGERIVTIEDSAELQLQQPHVVRLESRPSNSEGSGQVSIRDLVRNALRMRPDRVVVGEVRAGEALDMLQAMNTGHAGSMATLHSNSSRDAIKRLETMVLMAGFELPLQAIREQIASAVDLLVHVERLPTGERIVQTVAEVQGVDSENILIQDIMAYKGGVGGSLASTGLRPKIADKIEERVGPLPADMFRRGTTGIVPKQDGQGS